MDFKKLIQVEMGKVLKTLPTKVQAEMNVFIQTIGDKLTTATNSSDPINTDFNKLHRETLEKVEESIKEHNKMQANYEHNSSK